MKKIRKSYVVPLLVIIVVVLVICLGVSVYNKNKSSKIQTTTTMTSSSPKDSVDPYVNVVIIANDYNNTTRSYHRLIQRNTEQDQCLTLEEVTANNDFGAKILDSKHLCTLIKDGTVLPALDVNTNIDYSNFKVKDKGFTFDVDYNGMPLDCAIQNLFDSTFNSISCTSVSR